MPQVVLQDGLYCCNSMILRLFIAVVRFMAMQIGGATSGENLWVAEAWSSAEWDNWLSRKLCFTIGRLYCMQTFAHGWPRSVARFGVHKTFIRLSKGIGGEERTKILNTGVNRLLSVRWGNRNYVGDSSMYVLYNREPRLPRRC